MSVPIRLTDLRARAEAKRVYRHPPVWDPWIEAVPPDVVLALVDAVEAAHTVYEAEEYGTFPTGDEVSAWQTLGNALSRFDHGGADGQPTTTKGTTP